MTSEVVESFTKTRSDGKKTVLAMGVGNMLSGLCGGMGGNAMIGLSTINVLNGGKGRMAPTVTALVVMAATCGAYEVLNYIPVAALSGIMLVVVLHTFKWQSLWMLINFAPSSIRRKCGKYGERKIPRVEIVVIIVVTLMSILTNIAYSVIIGTAICAIMFSWTAAQTMTLTTEIKQEAGIKVYNVDGPIFFTTANKLIKIFDVDNDPDTVEVIFGYASVMDFTAVSTLQRITTSYNSKNKTITYKSLNVSSQKIVEKASSLVPTLKCEGAPAGDFSKLDSQRKVIAIKSYGKTLAQPQAATPSSDGTQKEGADSAAI